MLHASDYYCYYVGKDIVMCHTATPSRPFSRYRGVGGCVSVCWSEIIKFDSSILQPLQAAGADVVVFLYSIFRSNIIESG